MKLKALRRLFLYNKPNLSTFYPHRCFPFSTSLTPDPKLSNFFHEDVVEAESSAVYRHALKFQRPSIIEWYQQLENTASFIGSVTREPKVVASTKDNLGAYTLLNVQISNKSTSSSFRILLMMWGRIAEFTIRRLKSNDYIHVSGCLGSYTKADDCGNLRLNYKLIVKELNFVAQRLCDQGHKEAEYIEGEAGIQNDQNRLYLWQVFFANPHEWWDNRKRKLNPKQPDFRHKDTAEALWLSRYDPPWVKKQLQLLDSKTAEGRPVGCRSRVTTWVFDEL